MSRMNQANQRQRLGKLNPQVGQPTQSLVETVIFLVVVQALSFIESANTLEVLLMKDRLLRPSLVGVSKKIEKKDKKSEENKENSEN